MRSKVTLGVIVGNRGFFPDSLVRDGREEVLRKLAELGVDAVCLTPEDTKFGSVESYQDARRCADLFRAQRDRIDGILVTLPNFGDERAVAQTIRLADLNVPVLVHAFPDDAGKMLMGQRRDSFCGKLSVCNNLRQFGIRFSVTQQHTEAVGSEEFRQDIAGFSALCRVVRGMRNCRIGAIGARPAAFNTVRYSEKLLEESGISVDVLDLSEVFGRVNRLADTASEVEEKLAQIRGYVSTQGVPEASLIKMAKLGVVIEKWMTANELSGSAIQCWTSMQEHFGVVPCTVMSMMSNGLLPSACEVDIVGMISMQMLQFASGTASAIVDWNNNFQDDPDRAVIFHCSNLPKAFFGEDDWKMDYQEIIATSVGQANTYGTVCGRITPGPLTFLRVSTDDQRGIIRAYIAEGESTDDKMKSFGGYGVVRVPGMRDLMQYICREGFEHHVSVNRSLVAAPIAEAMSNYLGWDVYHHEG